MSVREANHDFYNEEYSRSNPVWARIRRVLSFDQRSKHRINWLLLNRAPTPVAQMKCVLEVGFGLGLTLGSLPPHVAVVGAEISANAARLFLQFCARSGRLGMACLSDTTDGLPFRGLFDAIICSHVLEHVDDDLLLLREFRRLVSSSGVVLINVPVNEETPDLKHLRWFSEESLRDRLAEAGFAVLHLLTTDRWAVFFERWEKRTGGGVVLKAARAACAVMPHTLAEWYGDKFLRRCPKRQLVVLAVPALPSAPDSEHH
jgi:SAM-dependent methyltransferase